jgi:hypothetical protein
MHGFDADREYLLRAGNVLSAGFLAGRAWRHALRGPPLPPWQRGP